MTSDTDRLISAGIPLQLLDGEVRLRLDHRALAALEAHYGTMGKAATALQEAHTALIDNLDAPIVDTVSVFLGAMLDTDPAEVWARVVLSPYWRQAVLAVSTAIIDAWTEGMPRPRAEGNAEATTESPATVELTGPSSGGSSPSSATGPTPSSGQ